MIETSYHIEDGEWMINLYESGMSISMPLHEAQHLVQSLIKNFEEIIEIETDE